jgi:hypothetical protein
VCVYVCVYVCVCIHFKFIICFSFYSTFCPNTTDDKERDEILHQKISIFRWIRETHLDIPETEHNESFLSFAESGTLQFFCSYIKCHTDFCFFSNRNTQNQQL